MMKGQFHRELLLPTFIFNEVPLIFHNIHSSNPNLIVTTNIPKCIYKNGQFCMKRIISSYPFPPLLGNVH